jgi:murein endopeptidase
VDLAELRLKCLDLALSIQTQKTAAEAIAQAKTLESWVTAEEKEEAPAPEGQTPKERVRRQY